MLQPVASWGDRGPHRLIKRFSGGAVNERAYWTKLSSMRRIWTAIAIIAMGAALALALLNGWYNG
jgi:hypothetical protein